ncbi:MAG: ABC transporter permease, partial [Egibacteraceae bacterium]
MSVNPVMRRELVERWRGRRAIITLTVFLVVLGLLLYGLYWLGRATLAPQFGFGFIDSGAAGPMLGRFLLEGMLFFVLLLVLFVAPGYAAAQLVGERERGTLPLLQVTLLRPWQIVVGKLGASVAWLALLLFAALPLGAIAFFLGGIALGDLLRGIGMILGVVVCVAAMGLGISSLVRRTVAAVVLTYALVFTLVAGTGFAALVGIAAQSTQVTAAPRTPFVLYANPLFGLADAVRADASVFGLPSPLRLFAGVLPSVDAVQIGPLPLAGGGVAFDTVVVGPGGAEQRPGRALVWLRVLGVHAALGALGLAVATRR